MDATCNAAGPSETVGTALHLVVWSRSNPQLGGATCSQLSPNPSLGPDLLRCKIAAVVRDCRSPDLAPGTNTLGRRPRIGITATHRTQTKQLWKPAWLPVFNSYITRICLAHIL